MKKMMLKILTMLVFFGIFAVPVQAQEIQDSENEAETSVILEEQYEAAGANDLYRSVEDDVSEQLQENGIDSISADTLASFSITNFFSNLWNTVKDNFMAPLKLLTVTLGIILLCSLVTALKSGTEENETGKVFNIVGVIAVCSVLLGPTINCITQASSTIKSAADFMMSFIPVFAGVMATSGQPMSALTYNTTLFTVVQVIAQIASSVFVPLLGIYLALSVTGAINNEIKIDGIAKSIKKLVTWGIGLLLTIFVALFTIQGIVSGSADTVSSKAAKFVLSSFVPVVGSAISDAYASVQGCLGLIKSSVGAFGIIVCIFTFLPSIVTVLLYMGVLNLAAIVGDMLSIDKVPGILRAASSVLSLIFALLLCFSLLLIVTVTIILVIGG